MNEKSLNIRIFFLFIDFIGVTLVNKIIQFPVHSSTAHHLHTIPWVHHPRSSLLPSPFIPAYPPPPPTPPLPGNHHAVVRIHEFLLLFLFCSTPPQSPAPHKDFHINKSINLIKLLCQAQWPIFQLRDYGHSKGNLRIWDEMLWPRWAVIIWAV